MPHAGGSASGGEPRRRRRPRRQRRRGPRRPPPHGDSDDEGDKGGSAGGRPPTTDGWDDAVSEVEDVRERLDAVGIDADGESYGLLYEVEDRDVADLREEVDGLASNFDHYDTHHGTHVESDGDRVVLASIWATPDAAQTASGFLTDIDGVDAGVRGHVAEGSSEESAESDDADDGGHPDSGGGRPPTTDTWADSITAVEDLGRRLAAAGVHEGEAYDPGAYGLLFEADREAAALADDIEGTVENFDHYDTHQGTMVRANHGQTVLVSLWDTEDAAQTASGFLTDVDGVDTGARGRLGDPDEGDAEDGSAAGTDEDEDIRAELAEEGIYAGTPHGEDVYAMVLYSEADREALFGEVTDLRGNFDRYDTHVKTAVYGTEDGEMTAVVSLWETADAAETASEYLADLPGVVRKAGEGDGFGTMGMFYTVKDDYREEFVDTFGVVGEKLETMDGHRETALLVNHEQDTDMFIASRWDSRENAMTFFRSEEFRDTVEWGREVLADTPRHVFLA
ncbi:heme-binding protein [Halapricum sp. CBA1109]|uniref:heme-binding protein n=1 Tax=Halapricum sp. CBA1109 TaxID=2668068 RepID=UPI0013B9F52B|nr:heme-binding protein [Halapricum sp. CBA1109]